ncbi:MAG: S-layer homology domain-containing protein [Eubacteriales bacterium]
MLTAVKLGLFTGDGQGNFNPLQKVTRAEAAAVIARVLAAQG